MNIESLKYFLNIEKYNSFSLAAEELCISQSSLSKHIKKLETELNCILFDRSTRSLKLTPAGISLKKYASNIIDNYNELILDLNKYSYAIPKMSIGYIPVINQYNIANYIGKFKNKHNELELKLIEGEHSEILDLLLNNKIDFAIIRSTSLNTDNLCVSELSKDELVIITSKNHPIANRKYVPLKNLSKENFISLGENSGVYNLFVEECRKYNFEPNILCFNSRIENILGLVSAELGIAPLMKRSVECFDKKDISTILLKENISSSLCLIHLKDKVLSQLELEFKNYLINCIN
ncbi:LysR substrate-binding domain-containing protein [Clostridium nigeriense]|uniref:LysR substrate-binding domain-containing protein n=1 Tax=Clostridium nigeriense TaxID=1805470 RepID=UPI003D359571